MSTQTINYGFMKPELTDPADITALNSNWDKVDVELNGINDELNTLTSTMSSNITKLQPKITYGETEPTGGNPGDVYIQLLDI